MRHCSGFFGAKPARIVVLSTCLSLRHSGAKPDVAKPKPLNQVPIASDSLLDRGPADNKNPKKIDYDFQNCLK